MKLKKLIIGALIISITASSSMIAPVKAETTVDTTVSATTDSTQDTTVTPIPTGVSTTYSDEETDTMVNGYAAANYATNSKLVAAERTDVYALDTFKNKGILTDSRYANVVKQSKEITKGITSDYEKVKAIHDWVSNNIWYDIDAMGGNSIYSSAYTVLQSRRTLCDGFANLTVALMQAAGFPAKYISGESDQIGPTSDAWTEVWVDNRWVFMDTEADCENFYVYNKYSVKLPCNDYRFDLSIAEYSEHYIIDSYSFKQLDTDAWDGTLLFYDIENDNVLKKVKNYPLNGLVTSTHGYKAKDLYADTKLTKHWNLAKDRVDSVNHIVFVKRPRS